MMDAAVIKARINIVEVVAQTVKLRHSGSNYVGLCPFHDNKRTPALAVFPATQTWRCFGACNTGGDVFAWVMRRDGCDFRTALAALNDGPPSAAPIPVPARAPAPPPAPPNAAWQARAREFIAECRRHLTDYASVMRYLQGPKRMLDTRTIHEAQLGFNPHSHTEQGERWGLRDLGDVWLPMGIVIPGIIGDDVWYIKIRQPLGRTPKYLHVKRPAPCAVLYGADRAQHRRVVALTEGEFDCLLLRQECGVSVGVATLGAQGNRLTDWLFRYLTDAEVILAVYDTDGKSDGGLAALMARSRKVVRATLPFGKDVTEFAAGGGNLFQWLEALRWQALAAQFHTQEAHLEHIRAMRSHPLPGLLDVDYGLDMDRLLELL